MKVLLVHNSYQQPGGEDVVFELERHLLESAGHEVFVYCRSNWEIDEYRGLDRLALVPKAVWAADTKREFAALLRTAKPDLVHVHNTLVMVSPSIYSACLEEGIPVVQTLHNYRLLCPAATFYRDGHVCEECTEHGLLRGVVHGCYRGSRPATTVVALMLAVHRWRHTWTREVSSYIALSHFSRAKFVQAGLPAEKIFVKPNFIDPDPGPGVRDGNYVMFVGRLSPEKRVSTVLAAWTRLGSHIPLRIFGGGPERVRLEAEAARRGLTSVCFEGHTDRNQTLAVLRHAKFLLFSSEWYENFPMAIGESFANGVPVICSRLGAMGEIVEEGRTGLHFIPGDADDLADKVAWGWDHPERIREMGNEARKEYEAKYTAAKNYPLLMEIYRHALTANHAQSYEH